MFNILKQKNTDILVSLSKFLNPVHWFQFADDAAVITGQEYENPKSVFYLVLMVQYDWLEWKNVAHLASRRQFKIRAISPETSNK